MARRPIFEPILVGGDGKVDRNLAALVKALSELDERLDLVAAPLVSVATGKVVMGGGLAFILDYRGNGVDPLILPAADVNGVGKSRTVYIVNNATAAVRVMTVGQDKFVDTGLGVLSIAAGGCVTLQSDGRSRWKNMTPTPPASPGAIFSAYWFSCVTSALKIGATNAATTDTVGPAVRTTKDMVCRGIKFYWKETSPGDSRTMKCTLWQRSGALRLETGHIVVSTTGVYTFTFPAPRTVAAYTTYIGTLWDESATNKRFTHTTNEEINSGNGGFIAGERSDNAGSLIGPYIMHVSSCFSAGAGDAVPTSTANGRFPIELILDPVPLD
jgi:hypothetical protein